MNDAADDLRCTRRLLACLRLVSSSGPLLSVAVNGAVATDTMLARLVAVRETQEKNLQIDSAEQQGAYLADAWMKSTGPGRWKK